MTTNNNNCVGCGCGPSIPEPCVPAPPVCPDPQPCTEVLDAFCVKYTGPALTCNDVTIIPQNTSVAAALDAIVDALCDSNCCAIPVTATIQNADYVFLCLDETATCPYNGLLYNWSAINLGISGTGRTIGGIVNIDPLANPINTWKVPNDADWYALALTLDPLATNVPFNNVAGGPLKSTTCWSIPNSAATNLSALSVMPSVYRNPSGTFSLNNGQVGLYWSATNSIVPIDTASAFSLVYNDNSMFKSILNKGHGLRLRLVRPIDCSEGDGDYIPNAYIDNAGNSYNARIIGTLAWLTEDLRDTKFNNGTNIPITASNSNWSAAASAGLCCYPDNKANYEIVYSIGCQEKKISFEDFTSRIPASTAKNVEVVRNWGTCVTKQEIDADNTVFSVAIEDSGWQDLLGFDDYYQGAMVLRKPQVRRVGTVLHFRGDLIVPLGQSEAIIPVTDPNVLYAFEKRRRPYETITTSLGTGVSINENVIWFNNREVGPGSGPSSVIPTSVLPADVLLDNTYTCSNNIGMRKLLFLDSELNPNFKKAKSNAPTDYYNQIVLTTYVNIEITQDKRLKIVPLNTLEFIGSANPPVGTRGSSVLAALTSNFYNSSYILDPKIMSAGFGEYATEISTTYPILKDGFAIVPGTYVVIAGDSSDGDWSNISNIASNTYFTSINVYGTSLPTTWGSVELVDIRAYQRRPYLPLNGTSDLKVWPSFEGDDDYDFFDTARPEFLGGFVFNLDNFMAFTDINNCYASFDGENSCENTPLPAEPGCCQNPLLYLLESTLASFYERGGIFNMPEGVEKTAEGIAPQFDLEEITYSSIIRTTLSNSVILQGNTIVCCPDCDGRPYYLGYGLDYLKFVEALSNNNPLHPDNLTTCCKQLEGDETVNQSFEEGLPGFLNPCPTSDFATCFDELAILIGPDKVSDLQKSGLLEINTINDKTLLCVLKDFLDSHPEIPADQTIDILDALLVSPLIIQCFPNGDIFIGGLDPYNEYLESNGELERNGEIPAKELK